MNFLVTYIGRQESRQSTEAPKISTEILVKHLRNFNRSASDEGIYSWINSPIYIDKNIYNLTLDDAARESYWGSSYQFKPEFSTSLKPCKCGRCPGYQDNQK